MTIIFFSWTAARRAHIRKKPLDLRKCQLINDVVPVFPRPCFSRIRSALRFITEHCSGVQLPYLKSSLSSDPGATLSLILRSTGLLKCVKWMVRKWYLGSPRPGHQNPGIVAGILNTLTKPFFSRLV